MADRDKTHTVITPGEQPGNRPSANMDGLSTQVISDASNAMVGTLLVIEGPGQGQSRPVFSGTNQVGRSADNRIALDFGDTTISRLQHAVIAYDGAKKSFRIYDGGKTNPVHVNGERLAGDCALATGDTIKIGLTTLKFGAV